MSTTTKQRAETLSEIAALLPLWAEKVSGTGGRAGCGRRDHLPKKLDKTPTVKPKGIEKDDLTHPLAYISFRACVLRSSGRRQSFTR